MKRIAVASFILFSILAGASADIVISPAVVSSDEAPGVEGWSVSRIEKAEINTRGDIVYLAAITDGAQTKDGIWRTRIHQEAELLALQGEPAPSYRLWDSDFNSRFLGFETISIGADGTAAFVATVDALHTSHSIWATNRSGRTALVSGRWLYPRVRQINAIQTIRDEQGNLARLHHVGKPLVTPTGEITFEGDIRESMYDQAQGLWWFDPNVTRYTPAMINPHFVVMGSSPTVPSEWRIQDLDRPAVNSNGTAVFSGHFAYGDPGSEIATRDGIWMRSSYGPHSPEDPLHQVATSGVPTSDGFVFTEFGIPGIDDSDRISFWALVTRQSSEVDPPLPLESIWFGNAGELEPIAISGEEPPDAKAPEQFVSFQDPKITKNGYLAFVAETETPGGETNRGIWVKDPDGNVTRVIDSRRSISGEPSGTIMEGFGDININSRGQIAFTASIANSQAEDPPRLGCWLVDGHGQAYQIFVQGRTDGMTPGGSSEVLDFELFDLNDGGQAIVHVSRADGSEALVKAMIEDTAPPTAPGSPTLNYLAHNRLKVEWHQSQDDTLVQDYIVRRDGVEITRTHTTSFIDQGLEPNRDYSYEILASDYQNNVSPGQPVTARLPEVRNETVVDDSAAEYIGSPWWTRSNDQDTQSGNSHLVPTGGEVTYSPDLPATGTYSLYAWISGRLAGGGERLRDSMAKYRIIQSNGVSEVIIDQNLFLGEWAYLGTFDFDVDEPASVVLQSGQGHSSNEATVADALRWDLLQTDVIAPTAPASLTIQTLASNRISLSWEASSDASGALRYTISRNGQPIAETGLTSFIDSEVEPDTTYIYSVHASDYFGNHSNRSAEAQVSLPKPGLELIVDDTEAEYVGSPWWAASNNTDSYRGNSRLIHPGSSVTWTNDFPVSGTYELYAWISAESPNGSIEKRDSAADYEVTHADGMDTVVIDQNQSAGDWAWLGSFDFSKNTEARVRLLRQSPGWNTVADALRWVLIIPENQVAPSVPQGVSARWLSTDRIRVTWDPSTDEFDTVLYQIVRDGEVIGETMEQAFEDQNLTPGQTYVYRIRAIDFQGNSSEESVSFSTTLPQPGGEVIVEETDAVFVGNSHWTPTADIDAHGSQSRLMPPGSQVTWSANLPTLGQFELHAWISARNTNGIVQLRDHDAEYFIAHSQGETKVVVDQNLNAGDWAYLGTFDFERTGASVRLSRPGPNWTSDHTIADAMRWVYIRGDSDAPSKPDGLAAHWVSSRLGAVSWRPAIDSSGYVRYEVLRDGMSLGETEQTEFTDTTAVPGTLHYYSVLARDFEGNTSRPSDPVAVRMPMVDEEIIVDETAAALSGPHWSPTGDSDSYGPHSRVMTPGSTVTWNSGALPAQGVYEIHTWVSATRDDGSLQTRDRSADYSILHANGVTTIEVDQNTNPGGWAFVGAFEFSAVGGTVSLSVPGPIWSATHTIADAVKWSLLSQPEGTNPPSIISYDQDQMIPGSLVEIRIDSTMTQYLDTPGELQVHLTSGEETITALNVIPHSQTSLSATFRIPASVTPSLWDLQIGRSGNEFKVTSGAVTIGDLTQDSDRNGLPELLDIAFGVNDSRSLDKFLPAFAERITPQGHKTLSLVFRRLKRSDAAQIPVGQRHVASGIEYSIEVSSSLDPESWQSADILATLAAEPVDNNDGTETVEFNLDNAFLADHYGFARVSVRRLPSAGQ